MAISFNVETTVKLELDSLVDSLKRMQIWTFIAFSLSCLPEAL